MRPGRLRRFIFDYDGLRHVTDLQLTGHTRPDIKDQSFLISFLFFST